MFKYRVLTFTIILSMLLFYATPINSFKVKADEVTYTQRQLQDVGAWFIGERLLEGAVENFNFDNLPTDVTADDFLADLGAIIVDGNPDPLLDHLGQAADDIWNGIEQELASWSSDDAWSFVKDFFYTLWYDVNPPQYSPLVDVLRIQDGINEQLGVYDKLLQYTNTDIPETYLPEDYLWFQNVNQLYFHNISINNITEYSYWTSPTVTPNNPISDYTFYINGTENANGSGHLPSDSTNICSIYMCGYLPKLSIYYDTSNNTASISSSNRANPFYGSNSLIRYFHYYSSEPYKIFIQDQSSWSFNIQSSFDGLNSALNYFYSHFYNINFYVDGVLWVQGYITPINPIASTDLTYPNYEPAKYTYPEGTSVDWNRLYSIIYNAVRDGIVLDFGDIEDCFVDVNGQTAIATLGLVRNDYDNLVHEQFTIVPYPRFNDNLWLTNLAEEMTVPAQNGVAIIENAYNIFPLPLQKALLFTGALLLFGLLIRRFLE